MDHLIDYFWTILVRESTLWFLEARVGYFEEVDTWLVMRRQLNCRYKQFDECAQTFTYLISYLRDGFHTTLLTPHSPLFVFCHQIDWIYQTETIDMIKQKCAKSKSVFIIFQVTYAYVVNLLFTRKEKWLINCKEPVSYLLVFPFFLQLKRKISVKVLLLVA